MKQFLFLAASLFVTFGCVEEQLKVYKIPVLDTLNVEFRKHDFFIDYSLDSVRLLFLDSGDDVVPTVSKILMTESMIYILSNVNSAIYAFEFDGTLVYSIDMQGNGPKAYNAIDDFDVNSSRNLLEILDLRGQKLLQYSANTGEYLQEVSFKFYTYRFVMLNDGSRIFHNSNIPNGDYFKNEVLNTGIFVSDSLNNITKSYLNFDSTGINRSRLVTTQNLFKSYDQKYSYVPLYSNMIYEVNTLDNSFRPKYWLELGRHMMPQSFLLEYKGDPFEFDIQIDRTDYAHYITDFYEIRAYAACWFLISNNPYRLIYVKQMGKTFASQRNIKT